MTRTFHALERHRPRHVAYRATVGAVQRHPVWATVLVFIFWPALRWLIPFVVLGILVGLLVASPRLVRRRRATKRERERQARMVRNGPWRVRPEWAHKPPRTSQQKWARHRIRELDPGYGELLDTCAPLGEPLSSPAEWKRVMPKSAGRPGPRPPAGGFTKPPGKPVVTQHRPLPARPLTPPPLPPTSAGKLDPSKPQSEQLRTLMRWHLERLDTLAADFVVTGDHVTVTQEQAAIYRAMVAECERLKEAIATTERAELQERNLAAYKREQQLAATVQVEHRPTCPACGMTGRNVELIWASMREGDVDTWRCGLGHKFAHVPPAEHSQLGRPSSVERTTK